MLDGQSHPNWPLALSILRTVLPSAGGFDPDDMPVTSWEPFAIEDRSDSDIAADLWTRVGRTNGLLLVVTFASYLQAVGPLFVYSRAIDEAIAQHAELFEDMFFSSDTCMIELGSGRVLLVHHEGLLATVNGRPVQLDQLTE